VLWPPPFLWTYRRHIQNCIFILFEMRAERWGGAVAFRADRQGQDVTNQITIPPQIKTAGFYKEGGLTDGPELKMKPCDGNLHFATISCLTVCLSGCLPRKINLWLIRGLCYRKHSFLLNIPILTETSAVPVSLSGSCGPMWAPSRHLEIHLGNLWQPACACLDHLAISPGRPLPGDSRDRASGVILRTSGAILTTSDANRHTLGSLWQPVGACLGHPTLSPAGWHCRVRLWLPFGTIWGGGMVKLGAVGPGL
jgi:hypothetical protein